MSQLIKKFIGNDQVDGTKIHLDNSQAIRARNAANSADVNILELDSSNIVQVVGPLNASGTVTGSNLSGSNTGDVTLTAVGASPSANGASLSGQALTLQPADATHPGLLSALTQSIGGAKTFSVAPASSVDAVAANELVRFSQLAALSDGLKPKAAVVAATTGNINLASATNPNPIDGHTLANGDRILLWQQTSAPENGIYVAVTATDPTTWTRATDFDMPAEIPGAYTVAEFGTLYQASLFVCLSSPGTIGVDPINFAERTFSAGANQSLSNLTGPTAINQDLIFDEGALATVKTKDDNTIDTWGLNVSTGNSTGHGSGQVTVISGTSDIASGVAVLQSGAATSTGTSGEVDIESGTTVDGASGNIQITSGNASGTGGSGGTFIGTGQPVSGDSGGVTVYSGTPTSGGNSGAIQLNTGATNGGGASGQINLVSGNTVNGQTGNVGIGTGDVSGTGTVGDLTLSTGQPTNGPGGNLILTTQPSVGTGARGQIIFEDGSEGTSGYVWTSTDTTGRGHWAAAGSATNNKELTVLSPTDITNQYVDLAHVAKTNSIDFVVKGGGTQIEGASYDYSVSYTGGAGSNTRITFLNGLATGGASALVSGDVVVAKYQY